MGTLISVMTKGSSLGPDEFGQRVAVKFAIKMDFQLSAYKF